MIVVVGAHSRNVGKTSLACAIMRATPQLQWTAIKISANRSGSAHAASWNRETGASDHSDTGRFLSAGARSAWWLRAKDEQLPASLPTLSSIVQSAPNVLIESNRVVDFLQPDFCLIALDVTVEDFKDSARRLLPRAHALVFVDRGRGKPSWASTLLPLSIGRPRFRVSPPGYESQNLTDEIRCRALPAECVRKAPGAADSNSPFKPLMKELSRDDEFLSLRRSNSSADLSKLGLTDHQSPEQTRRRFKRRSKWVDPVNLVGH